MLQPEDVGYVDMQEDNVYRPEVGGESASSRSAYCVEPRGCYVAPTHGRVQECRCYFALRPSPSAPEYLAFIIRA